MVVCVTYCMAGDDDGGDNGNYRINKNVDDEVQNGGVCHLLLHAIMVVATWQLSHL